MMRKTEVLWFEDVSAINEPVLSFPVIGRISMKQFFILGVAGMASYGIFSVTHGLISAIPISIGAFLSLVKPKVGTTEGMFLSVMLYLLGRRAGERQPFCIKKQGAGKAPKHGKKPAREDRLVTKSQNKAREIILPDLSSHIRFKTKLVGPAGEPIAYKDCRIFLDGARMDAKTTDAGGWLETVLATKTYGKKKIAVYVDGQKEPAFSDVIEIKRPQENLP